MAALCSRSAAAAALFAASPASAATNVYCTDSASDQATLQAAITAGGTVYVHGTCLGNWSAIGSFSVTLVGVDGATLHGAGNGEVLFAQGSVVVLQSLTITGGSGSFYGGGVFANIATLELDNTRVVGNSSAGVGGGVLINIGSVTLNGSTVSGNSAVLGGGIFGSQSAVSVDGSTVSGNTAWDGGGVFLQYCSTELSNTTVRGNLATGGPGQQAAGGGLYIYDAPAPGSSPQTPSSAQSPLRGSGGPIGPVAVPALPSAPKALPGPALSVTTGGTTVTDSSVDHNQAIGPVALGGGIFNFADQGTTSLTLTDSTVSVNTVPGFEAAGGGIVNGGLNGGTAQLIASGSSLGGNLAPDQGTGGALFNIGQSGGTAVATLSNTLVAQLPNTLNPNKATWGAGIFNTQYGGTGSVSLQSGADVVHNQAAVSGGGVYDDCAATLSMAPGSLVSMNTPNNIVNSAGPNDVFGGSC